jgi:lipoprotein-anchoring transpeptidase ErfK/SrfK
LETVGWRRRISSATFTRSWKAEGVRVSGQGVCFRGEWRWQLAILAAGSLAVTSPARAAIDDWRDPEPAVTQPAPKAPSRHAKRQHHRDKKSGAVVEKETKPQGPLIISISVAEQKLRLYDANGLFAESPVSTGMPGHPTPMGVFSIIQKQKFHRSNIYSGAPMPYMQRITWSGVAMHAGVLPGYPASHGCIRMPSAFAIKMYSWTRMGARVIVTPGKVTPESFSHSLLATMKVIPQPVAVEETKADVVAIQTPEKPAQLDASKLPTSVPTKTELRSTVGQAETIKSEDGERRPSTALKTADASGALPAGLSTPEAPVANDDAPKSSKTGASGYGKASDADPDAAKRTEAALEDKPVLANSTEGRPGGIADDQAKQMEPVGDQSAKPGTAPQAQEAIKLGDAIAGASPKAAAETLKSDAQGEIPSPPPTDDALLAAAATPSEPPATAEAPLRDDIKSEFSKAAAAAKPDPGFAFQGTGQIAVFVSRKDSKLYIRQNFEPLFQIPVTIAADARPLGTHIFTAQVDSNDHNVLHWSVVSLPVPAKSPERHREEHGSRAQRSTGAAYLEAKPLPLPDSPAEALDRLSLPAEVMAKIYEAVSTGGSIVVSDQGIAAGETGEGTDFIVSLR